MGMLNSDHLAFAARRWSEGATMQQIADEISEKWEFESPVHKQAIQYAASRDRLRFPKRTRDDINAMIAKGMRRAIENGFEPGPGLKEASREKRERQEKKHDELGVDFEW